MSTILELVGFLADNADLIEDLFDAVQAGTPKDAIRALIRQAKADASWAALKEELAEGKDP
jgi:hypothetical protein